MIIKMDVILSDLEDAPILDSGVEVTLAIASWKALLVPDLQEKNMGNKIEKYHLAQRLLGKAEIELTAEEIVLIKKSINVAYAQPLIVGQACDLLEQKDKKEN